MTAAGKITAATLFTSLTHPQGEGPVRVLLVKEDAAKLEAMGVDRAPLLQVATKKTGVETLAAVEAETRLTSGGFHRASRQYRFRTSQGWTAWMAAAQTMWLAPEDAAGVKRAHVEALKEDQDRDHAAKVRAQLRTADTDRLVDALTDASPSLATLIQAELDFRERAQVELEGLERGMFPPEKVAEILAEEAAPALAARLATGSVAEVLDRGPVLERDAQLHAYAGACLAGRTVAVSLAPGVKVAPIGSPRPTAEDLSDLAQALVAEDLEHVAPGERMPLEARPHCQRRDVVTIHRGDRLYEVLQVKEDSTWGPGRTSQTRVDATMAKVSPLDPEDHRDAQWVHVDLLHVRKPVARVTTEQITNRVRQTREVFRLEGQESLVVVRTILVDSARGPVATLTQAPLSLAAPVATLRVGEAIVVDGRCLEVTEDGKLARSPHRDRLSRS